MQIIIPMSGFGKRFKTAGYKLPKPLIEVDGKPIIQHVVDMFPGEKKFFFICNREHLESKKYQMKEILNKICPSGKIISIDPHNLGPVYAVHQSIKYLNSQEPTIVNYCDFNCYWHYEDFKKMLMKTKCDGAVPCYKGFHPHTIWSNYYAYVREKNLVALDIQEKKPFTKNPREEYASGGTYYFKNGNLMIKYFKQCIKQKLLVNGEYYVSMVYKPMIQEGLNIQVYKIKQYMQWGTPEDLEDYKYWSKNFNLILKKQQHPFHEGSVIIPMVGKGKRFKNEGYKTPKPLISISGKPMVIQALMDLPTAENNRIILKDNLSTLSLLKEELYIINKNDTELIVLNSMTDGQATTCIEGSKDLDKDLPITISACDNGMKYKANNFSKLIKSKEVDIIVWGIRGYPGARRSPQMYGWIDADYKTGKIKSISVKKSLNDTNKDPIIIGTFTFKKLKYFLDSVKSMKKRNAKVNGEYYIDTAINDAINNGLKCILFEIDAYLGWGTPNDLKTFQYWQACFHKWKGHSYSLENDHSILDLTKVKNIFL